MNRLRATTPTPTRTRIPVALACVFAWAALLLSGCPEDTAETGVLDANVNLDAASDAPTGDTAGADSSADGGADSDTGPVLREDLEDGEACIADVECRSGRCLDEYDGFPGGFCTAFDCDSREDCSGAGRACLRGEFNGNLCVPLCGSDADCREGYECEGAATTGSGYCYPAYASPTLNWRCDSTLVSEGTERVGFGEPADLHRISFTLGESPAGFGVTVFNKTAAVAPQRLVAPDGETLDLLDDYGFFLTTGFRLQTLWPINFPAGPDWVQWVQSGEYTLDVATAGDHVCWYVLETEAEGARIDLNFYFVGVPGLSADTAEDDPDFLAMLEQFDATISQAGFRSGDIRYFDVRGDVEETYQIIRSDAQVYELMSLSRSPGQSRRALLSANVFFVRDFSGEMFSVLGVAAGIPGVQALHGQEGTGLIFSASNLGNFEGNRLVGQVLAHELGHYLGLAHTSESAARGVFDRLADTPECPGISRETLQSCPDFDNLMFPIASFRDRVIISDHQALVLRSNPLVQTVSGVSE
jgi:hypothetical protein